MVAATVSVIGWLLAIVFVVLWHFTCLDRDNWRQNAELLSREASRKGQTRNELHNKWQSSEHDLEQLLQLARKIRVKRGKDGRYERN